jgi:hypothetical protein
LKRHSEKEYRETERHRDRENEIQGDIEKDMRKAERQRYYKQTGRETEI